MTSISVGSSGTASYGYTGSGLRAWKQTSAPGSVRTYFLYDGDEPVIELSDSAAVTAVNDFGANGLFARTTGGNSANSVFYGFDPQESVVNRVNAREAIDIEICLIKVALLIREYGPHGRAKKDYDFGHDHGGGDPHAHDWDWSKKGKYGRMEDQLCRERSKLR